MSMNLEIMCYEVTVISKEAGGFIRNELDKISGKQIESKGTHNYVTYVDKNAEEMIVKSLQSLLPEAGFITEEDTIARENKEYMWVIDPLDGTTNFIHGLPCFSVSIALMRNGKIILGVVYEINLKECFYAWEGGEAFMDGKKISVSDKKFLKDSLLATGFPYHDYSKMEKYLELFTWCLHNTHGVRRIGSAAVDLAYVACGRFDAFFEYGLNAWDVAAGAFIVQMAGGKVTDFQGGDDYIFGGELIATNSLIANEFVTTTANVFNK